MFLLLETILNATIVENKHTNKIFQYNMATRMEHLENKPVLRLMAKVCELSWPNIKLLHISSQEIFDKIFELMKIDLFLKINE